MTHLNSIWIEGLLVENPLEKVTQSGSVGCCFTLETPRALATHQANPLAQYEHFDVEVLNDQAGACLMSLSKGRGVRVIGRLKQERSLDPSGKKNDEVKILAELVELCHH